MSVVITVGLAALGAGVLLLAWLYLRARAGAMRAQNAERLAVERRDRFLAVAAGELDLPLATMRSELARLSMTPSGVADLSAVTRQVDEMRSLLSELARLPEPVAEATLEEVDVGDLVREIIATPPFSDRGPSVILRASSSLVRADRSRLSTGLRVLLWVVRRDVPEHESLVLTVSADEDNALVEVRTRSAEAVAEALDKLPAVSYGLLSAVGGPGTTLALKVASQVAQVHGGRLTATRRTPEGERFVLQLPRALAA